MKDESPYTDDAWDVAPCLTLAESGDDLARMLQRAASLLLKYPTLMQDLFVALMAEGREFAKTGEGQRWQSALAGSELVRHGRALWEASALNLLEDAPNVVIPSAVIDAIVHTLSRPDLRERLPELLHE